MNSLEQKRIEKLAALTFDRVIYYCKYVAKINVEQLNTEKLSVKEYFYIRLFTECQKIAVGLFKYEKVNEGPFSDVNVLSIISEIINEIDLNNNYPCSDAALFVASYIRFGVESGVRIITDLKLGRS